MEKFRDAQSREWPVEVNVDTVKRVRKTLQVDLLSIVDTKGDLLERLMNDPILLVDVLFVVCQPHVEKANVSDEDFGRAMAGDVIGAATTAFLTELANFFPDPVKRKSLQAVIQKMNQLQQKALTLAEARLATIDLDKLLRNALRTDGEPSPSGADTSDSPTPDR